MIESSDADGGSSVAVLTYLRCIIESINHPDLINIVFQYLLAVPEVDQEDGQPSRPMALARRRKSESLISNLAKGQDNPVPDLFNLIDLLLTSLQSRNQQTVSATLRLICALLRNRHQYHLSLFKLHPVGKKQSARSMEEHDYCMKLLGSMNEEQTDFEYLRDSYKSHIHDAQYSIECHECSSLILALPGAAGPSHLTNLQPHTIETSDSLFQALVSLLTGFMANDIETNVALTQVISSLALCGTLQLTPWLLPAFRNQYSRPSSSPSKDEESQVKIDSQNGVAENDETDGEIKVPFPNLQQKPPQSPMTEQALSPIFQALDNLTQQIETFRRKIRNFDVLLSERKHALHLGDEVDELKPNDSPRSHRSEELNTQTSHQSKNAPPIGSISQRLLSPQSSSQGSRATSPRGRRQDAPSTPGTSGRLSHLHIPPSPVSNFPDTRAFSPSPLRKASASTTPPRRALTPISPADSLRQKVEVRLPFARDRLGRRREALGDSETSSLRSESMAPEANDGLALQYMEVTLTHVLTNVLILQEFILELAAIIEVRASLFGEVASN